MNSDHQQNQWNDEHRSYEIASHLIDAHQTWELPDSVNTQIKSLFDETSVDRAEGSSQGPPSAKRSQMETSTFRLPLTAVAASLLLLVGTVYALRQRDPNRFSKDSVSQSVPNPNAFPAEAVSPSSDIKVFPVQLSKHVRSPVRHLALVLPSNDEEIEIVQLLPLSKPTEANQ